MKSYTQQFKDFSLNEGEGGFYERENLLPINVVNPGEPAAGYVVMLDGRPVGLAETEDEAQDMAFEIGEEIYPDLSGESLEMEILFDERIEIQEVGVSDLDELRTKIVRINKTRRMFHR